MTGRGRGIALTRPAWMEGPRAVSVPSATQTPPVISDWVRATAADARPYWYSLSSGTTTWTDPNQSPSALKSEASASPWREVSTGDGRPYYYNEQTKETQWHRPPGYPSSAQPAHGTSPAPNGHANPNAPATGVRDHGLPDGWAENRTGDGRVYYYHSATRETRWERPQQVLESSSTAVAVDTDTNTVGRKRPAVAANAPRSLSAPAGNAAVAVASKLCAQWKEHKTPDGKTYFYNAVTRETSWTKPTGDVLEGPAGPTDRKRQRTSGPVTDLRQLVSGSNALSSGKKGSSKPQSVVRRPRGADGKTLTDHQSESYFLKRAKIRKDTVNAAEEEGVVLNLVPNAQEEKDKLFENMLIEKGITTETSWLETMSRCAGDKRYTVLQPYGNRKHAWLKFVQKSAKEQRRKSIIASRKSSEAFMELMSEAFIKEPYSASTLDRCTPGAVKMFESDSRFHNVDERTRAGLIKSFFGIRARKGEREMIQKRKECLSRMREELDMMVDPALFSMPAKPESPSKRENDPVVETKRDGKHGGGVQSATDKQKRYFHDRTPFRELERFLSALPGSELVDSADLTAIIRDWRRRVERLTLEKKAREREARKALQRERRAAFRSGVEKMILEGRIPFSARWKEVSDLVSKEPFAVSQTELDSRPSDLFEDAMGLFDEKVQRHRDEFKQALKEASIEVDCSTTIDDLKKGDKLRQLMEALEGPVVSALLVDRQRRESKRRQKELQRAGDDFEALLQRSELSIETTFEAASEQFKERTAYKQLHAIGGEEQLKKVFEGFMEWLRDREQTRQKRKFDSHEAIPYDHAALAALQRAKRARLPGPAAPNTSFVSAPPLVPAAPVEEENGWAAALSSKPMTEKEKLQEKERRRRELLDGFGGSTVVKPLSKATK